MDSEKADLAFPVCIDILKICANGVDMLLDVSFKNVGCIWSGPDGLVTFNFS
jgi:hypothetical protein